VISAHRAWFPQAECNFHTQCHFDTHKCDYDTYDCAFNTHKSDFYTQSVICTCMSVVITLTSMILTLTRVITARKSVIYTHTSWFLHDTCDFETKQPKLTLDHEKNPDWVLTSGYTTRTSVIFTSCLWFCHDFNTHACNFYTHARHCNRIILRVGSTRICEDSTQTSRFWRTILGVSNFLWRFVTKGEGAS
jgi:hypothetical protein